VIYVIIIDPLVEFAVASSVSGMQISLGEFLSHYFGSYRGLGTGPLWFIEVLLIFTFIYVLWRLLVKPTVSPPQKDGKPPGSLLIAAFAFLLGVFTFVLRIWLPLGWVYVPLALQLPYFPQYIALFVVGVIAYRKNWFMGIPSRPVDCGWGSRFSVSWLYSH
jgi:glucan biosynthesis protein C